MKTVAQRLTKLGLDQCFECKQQTKTLFLLDSSATNSKIICDNCRLARSNLEGKFYALTEFPLRQTDLGGKEVLTLIKKTLANMKKFEQMLLELSKIFNEFNFGIETTLTHLSMKQYEDDLKQLKNSQKVNDINSSLEFQQQLCGIVKDMYNDQSMAAIKSKKFPWNTELPFLCNWLQHKLNSIFSILHTHFRTNKKPIRKSSFEIEMKDDIPLVSGLENWTIPIPTETKFTPFEMQKPVKATNLDFSTPFLPEKFKFSANKEADNKNISFWKDDFQALMARKKTTKIELVDLERLKQKAETLGIGSENETFRELQAQLETAQSLVNWIDSMKEIKAKMQKEIDCLKSYEEARRGTKNTGGRLASFLQKLVDDLDKCKARILIIQKMKPDRAEFEQKLKEIEEFGLSLGPDSGDLFKAEKEKINEQSLIDSVRNLESHVIKVLSVCYKWNNFDDLINGYIERKKIYEKIVQINRKLVTAERKRNVLKRYIEGDIKDFDDLHGTYNLPELEMAEMLHEDAKSINFHKKTMEAFEKKVNEAKKFRGKIIDILNFRGNQTWKELLDESDSCVLTFEELKQCPKAYRQFRATKTLTPGSTPSQSQDSSMLIEPFLKKPQRNLEYEALIQGFNSAVEAIAIEFANKCLAGEDSRSQFKEDIRSLLSNKKLPEMDENLNRFFQALKDLDGVYGIVAASADGAKVEEKDLRNMQYTIKIITELALCLEGVPKAPLFLWVYVTFLVLEAQKKSILFAPKQWILLARLETKLLENYALLLRQTTFSFEIKQQMKIIHKFKILKAFLRAKKKQKESNRDRIDSFSMSPQAFFSMEQLLNAAKFDAQPLRKKLQKIRSRYQQLSEEIASFNKSYQSDKQAVKKLISLLSKKDASPLYIEDIPETFKTCMIILTVSSSDDKSYTIERYEELRKFAFTISVEEKKEPYVRACYTILWSELSKCLLQMLKQKFDMQLLADVRELMLIGKSSKVTRSEDTKKLVEELNSFFKANSVKREEREEPSQPSPDLMKQEQTALNSQFNKMKEEDNPLRWLSGVREILETWDVEYSRMERLLEFLAQYVDQSNEENLKYRLTAFFTSADERTRLKQFLKDVRIPPSKKLWDDLLAKGTEELDKIEESLAYFKTWREKMKKLIE